MGEGTYTLTQWKVASGHEADFVEAWKALGNVFRALPHPPTGEGLLLQSMTDSNLYYSFGPWDSAEDIAAMREDTKAKAAIKRAMACCDEATPGGYRVIAKA
jgi:heme-degrading monooxygenase HmoA